MAGVVIVVAVTNPTAKSPAHGITLFLVDDGTPGFTKGKKLHKMGYKAQVCVAVFSANFWFHAGLEMGKSCCPLK